MAENEKKNSWLGDVAMLGITAAGIWLLMQLIALPDVKERAEAENIDEHDNHRIPSVAANKSSDSSGATKTNQNDWHKTHSAALNGFTFFLVIVGILQVVLIYSEQRSFVSLDSLALQPLAIGQPIVAQAIVENSGNSTAFIIDSNTTWKFLERNDRLPKAPEYKPGTGDQAAGPYVHGQSVETVWASLGTENITNQTNIDAIKSGSVIVYVYGYMKYRDLFRIFTHTTNFCMKYDARNSALRGQNFTRCGNRAYESAN